MKLIYSFFLFVIGCSFLQAQNINADCASAIQLCSTPNFTFNPTSGVGTVTDIPVGSNISNPSTNPGSSNSGCLLSGELKPQWLFVTIGNSGFLEFVFGSAASPFPQSGYYDWAMWPFTPTTCAGIQNNTLPPIRCNWNASSSGGTGIASATNIPAGGNAGNYEPPLAVSACQQFIICISNYSGVGTLVSFQSLGTASLTCNPSCLTVNHPAICAGNQAAILASSTGSLGNISFSINPGGISFPSNTIAVSPTVNTTYTVYATGLNSASVAVTQTAVSNVSVFPKPLVAPTVTQTTCNNNNSGFDLGLSFFPTLPVPAYTVNWSTIPAGVTSPTQTSFNGVIPPGVYTASVTAAGGCFTVTSFTILPKPGPASISLTPTGPNYVVNCYQPTVNINAVDATFSYTWSNGTNAPQSGATASFNVNSTGIWTIQAINPLSGCVSTKTISVLQNTVTPLTAISPTFQNITCNLASVTNVTATSLNPSVNVTHQILSPFGGSFVSTSQSTPYTPSGPGVYQHCVTNDANGCSTCKTFTVTSNQGFPTFSVTSLQNFTLGCSSKSTAVVNIVGGTATNSLQLPTGGAVSYTILGPGSSTVTPSGTLSVISNFSVTLPGTWTVITKDNASFCETRVPISIITNTVKPLLDTLEIPYNILNCNSPTVSLKAISSTPNIGFNWAYDTNTGNLASSTITISANFTASPTNTLVDTYTLTITDNNNLCTTTTVVPIFQNLFPPKAVISDGGVKALSCKVQTVMLTNSSSSNIPPNSIFTTGSPVIGLLWQGPSPMDPKNNASTYVGSVVGVYSMTAKDLGNGCTTKTVINISDNYDYPSLLNPNAVSQFTLDCGAGTVGIYPGVVGVIDNLNYSWTSPTGALTGPANSPTLSTNLTGLYRVVVTNTASGCAITKEVKIGNGSLSSDFVPDKEFGFAPHRVEFTNLSASTTGSSGVQSVWNFGNSTFSITNSASVVPSVVYYSAGTYTITMYAKKGDCLDTTYKVVKVELPSKLEIPNVFTPNGDNVNDFFVLKATGLSEITMRIFDRWGQKVYDLTSQSGNIAWDGMNLYGKAAAEGVYFYVLKAKGFDGQSFERKGNISLFR